MLLRLKNVTATFMMLALIFGSFLYSCFVSDRLFLKVDAWTLHPFQLNFIEANNLDLKFIVFIFFISVFL